KLTDYYEGCSNNCDLTDNGFYNHGTHTSGSVAGDDGTWHVYDGDPTGSSGTTGPHDGQAFDAFIQMQDLSNDGFYVYFDNITQLWQMALNRSSFIHSDSWGSVDFQAEYIQEAADTDNFIWNNQDFLVVFAAANAGQGGLRSMNLFGTAKNVITAGAAINSAREMTGTGAYAFGESYYPNDNQGFGRLTLDDALAFQGDARNLVLDDNRNGLNTSDVKNYDLAIWDASQSVEITLVWSDYPGTAGCNPCLVNDLDLTVHAPDGTLYAGNQYVGMNPGESQRNPSGSDHLNNVESVLVITGVQVGRWTVTVTANDVPNGPQPYAIVMTGGIATQGGTIRMDHIKYQSS